MIVLGHIIFFHIFKCTQEKNSPSKSEVPHNHKTCWLVEKFHSLNAIEKIWYTCLLLITLFVVVYIILMRMYISTVEQRSYPAFMVAPYRVYSWRADKFKSLFSYDGVWFVPQNQCSCPLQNGESIYDLESSYYPNDRESAKERRTAAFKQHLKRLESTSQPLLIAEPNSPLSYPVQGVEVMPLHTILIPGLGVHGIQRNHYIVSLHVSTGVLNTLAEVPQDVVEGQGGKQMNVSISNPEVLNFILTTITYTSTVYTISSVDLVRFEFESHTAIFPIKIRHPEMLKLYDHGKGKDINSLVTITIKTFLRYHKLRPLIKSIRTFYPNITIIVADDNENPEKIEDPHLEQYFMPFAKGWFAGRNLAVSQVTTKYFLWVDDDFLFTEKTKIENFITVLEESDLDVVGGVVDDGRFMFKLLFEKGNDEEGDCLHWRHGAFHPLEKFPNCAVTSVVTNFFLARTDQARRVGFDPKHARVAHPEFFIDGLGILKVGSCTDVIIQHQSHAPSQNKTLAEFEKKYLKFRVPSDDVHHFRRREHFFKNRLKCFSRIELSHKPLH
ncbi:beta-1,4 N-acetylgalactosaminyltransferase 2-like [Protopterus annectens]|uniref:beta-1,4 N-acetylgalactosaminyltransferase 2-like n=1 Tax=Protopterus annectens TaxID=7888 RepID=UPI001CFA2803|nr:beta-1,4 N-acetylgalactosaminyltransferase 2-like [Protopterus annectens]